MNNHLLIWDIDGTLILGRGIGRRAMDQAFLELYGIENGFESIEMAGMLDAVILKNAYELHHIQERNSEKYFEVYCRCLEKETKKLDAPIYAPGIPQLLEVLQQKSSFYNALGTGNVEGAALIKLAVHGMHRYFQCGGYGDKESERWQIIQEAIFNASKLFNVKFENENIYVIGDTPRDIACGKKLDVKSVGVTTGEYSIDQLSECGADFVFKDFTDIDAFFEIFK